MSDEAQRIEAPEDEPPKSGIWVDPHDFELTDEEIAQGEHDGFETPDVDYVEIDGERVPLDEIPDED